MSNPILDELKTYEDELIAIRHDIHRHPEVGFEEQRTAALVAEKLRGWGIDVAEGVGKTGVVGTLKGRKPGQRAIGLRADLDALNIQEVPGREHGSAVAGKILQFCGWSRKGSSDDWLFVATSQTLPPRPPAPPSGPPLGTYFSRRKETQPFPPSPAFT